MYRTIEDIKRDLENSIKEYAAKRKAWEAVTIKTRKNGEEYKTLTSACISGANIQNDYTGKVLSVGGWWARGFTTDRLKAYTAPEGLVEMLTPEIMRTRIHDHIAWLQAREEECRDTLAWLNENEAGLLDKLDEFRTAITAGCPDKQHIQFALGEVFGNWIKYGSARRDWR